MPKNKLNKIRNGKQFMRADEIWRISIVLKTSVSWLLNDDAKPEQKPLGLDVDATWVLDSRADQGADSSDDAPILEAKHRPRGK